MQVKFISSLEKCFLDQTPNDFSQINRLRLYKNCSGAFQVAYYDGDTENRMRTFLKVSYETSLPCKVTFRLVENVPNYIPAPFNHPESRYMEDGGYLRVKPGLYPDVLTPLTHFNSIPAFEGQLRCLWVDVEPEKEVAAGEYQITIKFTNSLGETVFEDSLELEVINACLPEQHTRVTQWFYADCLADYYDIEPFSEKHFEICESFIKTAVENRINMILVPLYTPCLDTREGEERTTTQLLKITKNGGKYEFDFSLLDRWLKMCERVGVKYFEFMHLFTQWGAYHAPKIMATVDGEYKRIFGWDTDAVGEEYVEFLNAFLPELTAYLKREGYAENSYFHISDEPSIEHLEQYKKCRDIVRELLKGFKIIDACSDVDYYQKGLCDIPVPVSPSINAFLREDIKERWIYYCCEPIFGYSNKFLSMHSSRIRSIGIQMYKYDIEGYLNWGYNFYNNQFSDDIINPYLNANGGYWAGGGDAFCVYPSQNGKAWESLRLISLKQAFEDICALQLCEQYYSKDFIISQIEEVCGNIVFDKCINDTETMQKVRDVIDELIIKAV